MEPHNLDCCLLDWDRLNERRTDPDKPCGWQDGGMFKHDEQKAKGELDEGEEEEKEEKAQELSLGLRRLPTLGYSNEEFRIGR